MAAETYLTYKGIPFPMVGYSEESLNYVENSFQLLDDDVINVAFPKSGTNWMAEILGLIRQDGDPSWVRSMLVWDRMPWLETTGGQEVLSKYPAPRLMSCHMPCQLFPKSFLHSKAKVIYTVRNPKDVLASYYHFTKIFKTFKDYGSQQEFFDEFMNGNVPYGSWFDHVNGWMKMKDKPNFFIVTYEELLKDPRGSVEKICRFLGKQLNSQQIDSVVENASFRKMKDNKMSNFTQVPDTILEHNKGNFMRKGISGDWKNFLTVAQNEYFDRVYQEKMRGLNVTFPWE